jgi:hypothetical protein
LEVEVVGDDGDDDDDAPLETDAKVVRRLSLRCAPLILESAFIQRSISPRLSASR